MAKGKKTKKTRRRKVGAMSLTAANPIVKYGPIVLGYFLADKINAPIDSAVGTKVDSKIIAAGQVGLGAYLVFGKSGSGKGSMVKTILGGIMLGAGAKRGMAAFGLGNIGGYGAVPVIGRARVNGYGAVPVIGSAMGAYSPNGQLGNYKVPQQIKVMSGVDAGLMKGGGSMME